MFEWLKIHGQDLRNSLHEGSGVFAEWIGMGVLKYEGVLDKKAYIFAKANIELLEDNTYNVKNINYRHDLFIYPFGEKAIPDYLDVVPVVKVLENYPDVKLLDEIYWEYCSQVNRNVEGFVIQHNNNIKKYVRMKNGTLQPHKS